MKLQSRLVLAALIAELSLCATAQAQGLLGQIFSPPTSTTDETATTRRAEPDTSASETRPLAKPVEKSKPKPQKKAAWRAPLDPPLPPPRPSDEALTPPTEVKAASRTAPDVTSHIDTPPPAEPQAAAKSDVTPQQAAPSVAPSRERSMVLIVRDGVRGPQDLQDRRIATGLSTEDPDELRRMVEQSAGVRVSPVAIGWSAGLASLARGEIDGVLLSLGPKVAASETEGVTLAGYQLLEIPLASGSP